MKKVFGCFKNECTKLFSRKKYYVFMIIEMLICFVTVCTKLITLKLSGGNITLSNVSTPLMVMSLFYSVIIPFISIMAVCELFASEFSDKTIRSVFSRPIERYKVYIAKTAAVLFLAVINMAVVLLTSSAADFLVSKRLVNFGYTVLAYIFDIAPMLIVILMAVMINQFVKSSTMAMFLCIIVYAGISIAEIFIPSMSGLVFTGFMQWHKIWLGGGMPFMAVSFKALLLIGYGMIFGAIGYYIFRFKEC